MAITFPRSLPFSGSIFASGSDLSLSRGDARNRDGAGMLEVMELADPLWSLKLVTKPLRPSARAVWKAWAMTLQGGIQLFYGYPPIQQYPMFYHPGPSVLGFTRVGGGTFNGTTTLTAFSASALSLSGLPFGFVMSAGDYVSVPLSTGSRMLHMVTEDLAANVSGVATISVTPPVRPETALGSNVVQFVQPKALFVLRHETFNAPDGEIMAPVSFEAMQTVRAV